MPDPITTQNTAHPLIVEIEEAVEWVKYEYGFVTDVLKKSAIEIARLQAELDAQSQSARPAQRSFERGAWRAFDCVLNWINTWPEQSMDKAKLYSAVMQMRPPVL